ncbi:uncharacterized protein LOC131613903 [Vicia villosa]|uniref:uncharacterized protein LOC131613903 n=1 Tax=Vicia villosa TaxID=3911 RepID=UPI00273CE2BC|nr:uncharacterized protein LOC131613903 [Vicia villosa]
MNIGSFNIRGGGNPAKRRRIGKIMELAKEDLCFIQETKLKRMESFVAKSFWGAKECEWPSKDSEGASGGMLTIWNKGAISPLYSFKGKGGEWIVGGDFNSVKVREERRGKSQSNLAEMEEFAKFIELLELVDLPIVGNKFSWISSNGNARSRLDRILLSEGIIESWKVVAQMSGKRDISDHRPIWIKSSNLNWGPKPFKVFHAWYEHKEFMKFVDMEWNLGDIIGTSAFVLKEKFKRLRVVRR